MIDERKKALLVVSFGTSDPKGRELSIEKVEGKLKEAFPGRRFYRAWTSGMIIKIQAKRGIDVDSVTDAVLRMKEDGIEDVLVQPTHILPGEEYEKLMGLFFDSPAMDNEGNFKTFNKVAIGRPLISDRNRDIEILASEMSDIIPKLQDDEITVFVGHGTKHKADEIYSQMEETLHKKGFMNTLFVTLEGSMAIRDGGESSKILNPIQLNRIKALNPRKIHLIPFLFVCGEHVQNDIAGESADSVASLLKTAGYDVNVVMKGLGEYPQIQDIFISHAKDAE